jgi:hypothetical protein
MDCYRVLGASHDAGSSENKLAESYAAEPRVRSHVFRKRSRPWAARQG